MENKKNTYWIVVIAALGYFVDIYDLILFNVVKGASLNSIGITGDLFKSVEITLFNWQMFGMLLGGLIWGILGDKKGRVSVLFGSIVMYSLANIANGFVVNIDQYIICRFIAGVGLAGELRQASNTARRLGEAARLGFTRAIIPASSAKDLKISGIKLQPAETVAQALALAGLTTK
mgnify:CR=1 FL=1